jgi:hypothetical protein
MKRDLWTQPLTKRASPAWPCPACGRGTLALVPNTLVENETAESRQSYQVLGEPESITSTFAAWLKCNYGECGEDAVVVGKGTLNRFEKWSEEGESEEQYEKMFHPLFCLPMPDMFELPEKCPDEVKSELRAGFQLFWSDQSAAANHVRIALERLMDHLRIPKRRRNKKGKFFWLTLHDRINEEFRKTKPEVADQLLALKWLGNTGSHEGKAMRDDVLVAFEILEDSLFELVEQRSRRITALSRTLTKRHGHGTRKCKPPF